MKYIYTLILLISTMSSYGQCATEAGLYCDPSVPNGAPILCDIDCLDGFTASMPDSLYEPQPYRLCDNGGDADNMSWFAFVAGSDSIALTVTPSGCTTSYGPTGAPNYRGIQAGLMRGCDLDNPDIIACYNRCDENGLTPRPARIETNQLIPGQTYYFYVDGCGGSQCDYTVTVDYGNQPFAIGEPDSIYSSQLHSGDTTCTGIEALDFTLVGVDSLINYNWRISPPIDAMPDLDADGWGELADVSSATIVLPFDQQGVYRIMAWADNDCDKTDSLFFDFTVADIDPVVFDSVELCITSFPYIGPFQNGTSWMSGPIGFPGYHQETVEMPNGCSYEESVYVSSIGSGREDVVVSVCDDDYPIVVGGVTINSPADAGFYTLGLDSQGCDSLINIIIQEQEVFGTFVFGSCSLGAIDLAYRVDSTSLTVDSFSYEWVLESTAQVVSEDSVFTAVEGNTYLLRMISYIDGNVCSTEVGPITANNAAAELASPVFIDPDLTPCPDETTTTYLLATDGNEDAIWYQLPEVDSLWQGESSLVVDWTLLSATRLCAFTTNQCATSDTICIDIERQQAPMVSFTASDTICAEDELEVTYTGDSGVDLIWSASGASAVDLGGGMFGFTWSEPGLYDLALTGTSGDCSMTTEVQQVAVLEEFSPPVLSCHADQNSITIEWPQLPCVSSVSLDTGGTVLYTGIENSFTIDDLDNGQVVNFNLTIDTECGCWSSQVSTTSCVATVCPEVTIDIDGAFGEVCAGDMGSTITYSAIVDSGPLGPLQGTWSGDFIDPATGVVVVDSLTDGVHTYVYSIVDDGCVYQDSITLNLYDSPQLILDTSDPDCYDDSTGMISIDASGGQGPYTFFINGTVTDDIQGVELEAGDYQVEVVDDNNCADQSSVEISIPSQPNLSISGSGDLPQGSSDVLTINTSAFVNHVIDSILWQSNPGGTLCDGCTEVSVSPEVETSYLVTVFFDDGCVVEETYLLSVRPETQLTWSNIINPSSSIEDNRAVKLGANTELYLDYFYVYDRWGSQVYSLTDQELGKMTKLWDGTLRGQPALPGVYVLSFQVNDGTHVITKSGTITVIR